ncbi:MAG: right-handed parallel beta-helix repeat-containing protein [Xanthomonadales bacterium]|nr:right-handed parallel beta-helix repeat-containing protein [Xanthomonadales bacterium]
MKTIGRGYWVAGWLWAALWVQSAQAIELCVNSVGTLEQALALFPLHGPGQLTIKVVQGTYAVGSQLGGIYLAANATSLALLGGYTAGCATRMIDPSNTIIDAGGATNSGLVLNFQAGREVRIESLSFTRFNDQAVLRSYMNIAGSDAGAMVVRNSRFVGNTGRQVIVAGVPRLELVNNLIADNTLAGPDRAAVLDDYLSPFNSYAVITNNTIANNSGAPGLALSSGLDASDRITEIANNIIWGNGAPDIDLSTLDHAKVALILSANVYGSVSNPGPLATLNLITNPLFVNAGAGNYALSAVSPAVNSGASFQLYGLPSSDLLGHIRIIGSGIDRGALESTIDDTTQFVVTNTADNGSNANPSPGSLRAAIKAANAASGPYLIRFDISGGCPRVLNMASPMLDVVGNVTIDGRTQTGWTPNTSEYTFNANLCLVLNGSGIAPYAFHVPAGASNARLTVLGMQFAGFGDAAIKIEGGSGHRIAGNQFGAVLLAAANQQGIHISGSAGSSLIGGFDDFGNVNLIAKSLGAGIQLDNAAGGSTIANNLIGFQPDGTGDGGNTTGVFIFNSPNNLLQYNRIGNSASNGVAISGSASSGNILQYNFIGQGQLGSVSAPNQGAGVNVLFSAHDNTIGATQTGTAGGNTINNNVGPGVWVSTSGGNGNRVLANTMRANGTGSAGVDVDLAAPGPSGNQVTSPGNGPNRLQNYPNLTSAVRLATNPPTADITATLSSTPNRSYRIDVYRNDTCDPQFPARGEASIYLGQAVLQTDANGLGVAQFSLPYLANLPGKVSATATSSLGDTSEIGTCIDVVDGMLPDILLINGFEDH